MEDCGMSGLDIIIYIAGLLLLTKFFMKELIGVVRLGRRLLATARDPLPPSRQLEDGSDTRSKNVSDLAVRKTDE
jgi:hypothetical protein